jgi:hypothetical protein
MNDFSVYKHSLYPITHIQNEEGEIIGEIIIVDLMKNEYTVEFIKDAIAFDNKYSIGDRVVMPFTQNPM